MDNLGRSGHEVWFVDKSLNSIYLGGNGNDIFEMVVLVIIAMVKQEKMFSSRFQDEENFLAETITTSLNCLTQSKIVLSMLIKETVYN